MKRYIPIIILILFFPAMSAAQKDDETTPDSGVKMQTGKSSIQEEELYPYIIIEQEPPLAASRGSISGDIDGQSLVSSMSGLVSEYGLAGWIKKNTDGTYRFHLEGDPDKLKEALSKIQSSDKKSRIDDVQSRTAVPTKYIKGFKVLESDNSRE
jgi:acylphosphatase